MSQSVSPSVTIISARDAGASDNLKPLQDEHPASTAALEVLEEIDDDLDEQGIVFVKLDDEVFYLNYTRNSSIRDFE